MNGVDKSDQYLSKYNSLRKCVRWWKTLFFHLVDIAIVNGFILFQSHRRLNKDNPALERPKTYALLDFREAVCRQLVGLTGYGNPPASRKPLRVLMIRGFSQSICLNLLRKSVIVKFAMLSPNYKYAFILSAQHHNVMSTCI